MGISGYGTHFGGMILSWLIIIGLFAAIIYIVFSQAQSGKSARDGSNNDARDKSDHE